MDYFQYQGDTLFAEQVAVADVAEQFGTPLYVYSRATFERHYRAYESALVGTPHLICYAVKANSNLAVLNLLARLGSGFDIVSQGELERVLAAGGDPAKVVFSGVGKLESELARALDVGVHCFNVESEAELHRLNQVAARKGVVAPLSLRVNPDVDARTHPYISTGLKENKFGVDIERALEMYRWAQTQPHLDVMGLDCHIGSQLTELQPFLDAVDRLLVLLDQLDAEGIHIRHLDLGGGLGVRYRDEQPPLPTDYVSALVQKLAGRELTLAFEPGRSIAANAGILVTRVEYLKATSDKHFAVVDAAMNDLLRPSLYNAWQDIVPVQRRTEPAQTYDVVGPVCETGDFLGKDRELALQPGDLLAVRSAGAYGFSMASNYNSRNRVAEVMVDGDRAHLIRRRETFAEQYAAETLLPDAAEGA